MVRERKRGRGPSKLEKVHLSGKHTVMEDLNIVFISCSRDCGIEGI